MDQRSRDPPGSPAKGHQRHLAGHHRRETRQRLPFPLRSGTHRARRAAEGHPALRESLDGTDFNAIRAGMVALRKLTPQSPDARNAATDLAETAASNRAAVPSGDATIQRLPNGRYRVHDPTTGEEIGQAPNRGAAVHMAQLAMEGLNPRLDGADENDSSEGSGDGNCQRVHR